MKFLRFSINDDIWNFYLVPEDDDTTLDHPKAEAEVDFEGREVHIKENSLNLISILHELWHIHIFYCFLASTDISTDDMEEVSAELFSVRGLHIVEQGKRLLKALETLKAEED